MCELVSLFGRGCTRGLIGVITLTLWNMAAGAWYYVPTFGALAAVFLHAALTERVSYRWRWHELARIGAAALITGGALVTILTFEWLDHLVRA